MTYEEASQKLMVTPQVIAICCLEKIKPVFSEIRHRQNEDRYEREVKSFGAPKS